MDLLLLLLMLLLSHPVSGKLRRKCRLSLEHQDGEQPWSFYRPGDYLVGIVVTEKIMLLQTLPFDSPPSIPSHSTFFYGFLNTLPLIYAVQLVNKNSQLLHNLTLGCNIHDNYSNTFRTSDALLDMLSTGEANVPNYGCGRKENLLALFDGAQKDISSQMSTLADTYKVSQVCNSQLLHNLTLGYNIHDNYLNTLRTADALLDMLSTGEANVPNYGCGRKENLLALLDGASREISIQASTLGGTYKIPQISRTIVSEALSDKRNFPFFHQMNPKEGFQYSAIVQLLLHFRWTLIGLFASDTENGENFMRIFPPVLVRSGICVVISQLFSTTGYTTALRDSLSKWRQVNVFVHFIELDSIWDRILPFHLTFMRLPGPIEGKVWIFTNFAAYPMNKRRLLKYIDKRLFCQRPQKMHPESPNGDPMEKEQRKAPK
ncbi:uncharacterized protein LOC132710323 [Pantherophis guttatus]|uniref:Uncharacterized protein LOC132710323 n=1 Tax=Pantherophis guttatus TaxID=94885 RepID=A0ABM3Z1N6_PANGU|nr:uncharacterized protein LOC132710323 [Pantherophis guttatus]